MMRKLGYWTSLCVAICLAVGTASAVAAEPQGLDSSKLTPELSDGGGTVPVERVVEGTVEAVTETAESVMGEEPPAPEPVEEAAPSEPAPEEPATQPAAGATKPPSSGESTSAATKPPAASPVRSPSVESTSGSGGEPQGGSKSASTDPGEGEVSAVATSGHGRPTRSSPEIDSPEPIVSASGEGSEERGTVRHSSDRVDPTPSDSSAEKATPKKTKAAGSVDSKHRVPHRPSASEVPLSPQRSAASDSGSLQVSDLTPGHGPLGTILFLLVIAAGLLTVVLVARREIGMAALPRRSRPGGNRAGSDAE